jgi:quercetin dioxygenase-like cupin family protein
MIRSVTALKLTALAGSLAALVVHAAAQDPVQVSPAVYKVKLENARVRILEVHARPGQTSPMHAHPDYVAHYLTDATIKVTREGQAPVTQQVKAGDVVFRPAQKHSMENIGSTDFRVLVVELKGNPPTPGR